MTTDVPKVVAAFDFDGTITTRDTFLPFLDKTFGRLRVRAVLAKLAPEFLSIPFGMSSRDQCKEKVIAALFSGVSCDRIDAVAGEYAETLRESFRRDALERISWHQAQGHRCLIVSASLDVYLQWVARDLGFDNLLCTTLERLDGQFTGKLVGGNCRRQRKVTRMASALGDLSHWTIYAYGDSSGDAEMLRVADFPHLRPFRAG